MKALLGFNPSNDKDQGDPMIEGDDPEIPTTTTWMEEEHDLDPGLYLSSDSESEEKTDHSPATTEDMD